MNKKINQYRFQAADQVQFKCHQCKNQWKGSPGRVEDAPERGHPFEYFADCPECDTESPQVAWQAGLMSGWAKSTGPKTEQGKAIAASNLDGHPTPEETARTRFNAMTHGLTARQAKFFPAKPGKYPHCQTCDIEYSHCIKQPACLKRTELFMKHHLAFEHQDPDMLRELQADLQAGVSAVMEDMLLSLINDGVTIEEPQGGFDKDGGFHLAQYTDPSSGERVTLKNLKAHPLLKVFGEYLSRNSLSLAELNMTPKVKADQEIQMGHIQVEETDRQSLKDLREKQTKALTDLRDMVSRSQDRINKDPVYVEHQDAEQSSS